MTYIHSLNQIKSVFGIQQMFGSRRPRYEADFHRERDTWYETNRDIHDSSDALKVEHGEQSGRISFN